MFAKVSSLMLVVTTACNLSCRYCYEGQHRSGEFMSLDTALHALDMIAASGKPFHVQITGGEPLLAADTVSGILKYIVSERFPATTAIQTNGVLLNRDCARKLKEYGTAVGISVDGLPGIQERLRGESAATYRAMRVLDNERLPFSVTTVLTSENTVEIPRFAMALNSLPMASAIGLDLLVQKGSASGHSGIGLPDAVMLRQGITGLLETLEILNRERSRPLVLREKRLLIGSLNRGVRSPFCRACAGSSIAVTPGGELYPCTQTMGDPEFLLGRLDEPRLTDTVLSMMHLFERQKCRECDLQGRCPGDCPSRQYYNGNHDEDPVCAMYLAIYDYCKKTGEIPL